jgi:hypothetical protein
MERDSGQFWDAQKNWFFNQKGTKMKNFRHAIKVGMNKSMTKFGIIYNYKGKTVSINHYQVFFEDSSKPKHRSNLPPASLCRFGRSMQSKEDFFIILKSPVFGSKGICFLETKTKTIDFKENYLFANQDIQSNHNDLEEEENLECMLQSVCISLGDQEIYMKTEVIDKSNVDADEKKTTTLTRRKSCIQKVESKFPTMAVSLGQSKLIFTNMLKNGKSYIFDIPKGQKFLHFVQFNNFSDIGFYPNNLNLELASLFAFITFDRKSKNCLVNIIVIDPYFSNPQIAWFVSDRKINQTNKL